MEDTHQSDTRCHLVVCERIYTRHVPGPRDENDIEGMTYLVGQRRAGRALREADATPLEV